MLKITFYRNGEKKPFMEQSHPDLKMDDGLRNLKNARIVIQQGKKKTELRIIQATSIKTEFVFPGDIPLTLK